MAFNPRTRGPRRALFALLVLLLGLGGLIAGAHQWGSGQLSPKLGLDLEGGTQMVLEPVLADPNAPVSAGQLDKARDIISQRVDANGVAEAQVTTQGGRNIVVSIPGSPDPKTLAAIRKPSQLRFRPVLAAAPGSQTSPQAPAATPTGAPTSAPAPAPAAPSTPGPVFTLEPAPSSQAAPSSQPAPTSANAVIPPALTSDETPPATPSPTLPVAPSPSLPATSSAASPSAPATSTASPTTPNASDPSWVTKAVVDQFTALDCSNPTAVNDIVDDPATPLVTCSQDRTEKYILGPVELDGTDIADATSGYQTGPNGQPTSVVEVRLSLTGDGARKFADVTTRLMGLKSDQTRNRFAIVLDKLVVTAPSTNAVITNGQASITGSFTVESARDLAQQLKFGALPMSFALQTQDDISPTLGKEQLALGLLAGLLGLLLVVGYSLLQYRLLGLVTVASLVLAAVLTYEVLTVLGWSSNVRLTMAGVTGVIVAIGVTADSFIVYFERIRDEVREGRPLVSAVEAGWARARRTILAGDAVNVLAAVVLYVLAASNVRGFAFTLGVTTLIDLAVVFLFTHPVVALLARTRFFGQGHPWSGLDPRRLGAKARYAGRGRFAAPAAAPQQVGAAR